MPLFNYRALDGMGVKTRGTVDAVSKTVAMDVLSDRGLFVTRIGEEHTKEEKPAVRFLPFISPVSSNEIVMLNRRLATLIGSDIPMVESLKATTNQVENRAFRRILEQVTEDVKQGHSLSNALSKHPRVFPDLMISMVRVGETGGILSSVLGQLADFTEKDKEIKAEVKTALAYPALVLTLAIATVIFLMTFILPRLAEFFMGMRVSLPLPTIMLLSISTFIQRYAVYVFIPFVVLLIGLVKWVRTSKGKRFYDSISVGIPFLGGLKRKSAIARFCRSLGALVRGGVPLMEALDVVKHILNNVPLQEALDRVQERVRKGDTMSRGFSRETIFPEMVRYMVSSGEESGKLDEMLFKVAEMYELETRNAIKVVVSLLAPMLILVVAGVVGFIAMAMLLPIFQINQMIR